MANVGVTGRVVDEGNNPLAGLRVAAYDIEVFFDEALLGYRMTSATGNFSISYSATAYGLGVNPNIRIRIYDAVYRVLYESQVYRDVTDPVLSISPDIVINRADAEGWLVTGLRRGAQGAHTELRGTGTPQALSTGNEVTFLVDGQTALLALTKDFQDANDGSIRWLLHYHEVGAITALDDPYDDDADIAASKYLTTPPTPATGKHLEEELLGANGRGVAVWIVANDFPLPSPVDAAGYMEDYLKENAPNTVQFARFDVPMFTPMHAKVVVIANALRKRAYLAIAGGSQEYFDGTKHFIDDPRRGTMGLFSFIKVPVHDVYGHIEGPAVNHADEAIRLHWDAVSPTTIPALPSVASPSPAAVNAVQIVRTLPKNRFGNMPEGETGVLEAYQRAFRNATDFIYLENQYFTEQAVADSLLAALEQNTSLVAIILINIDVDILFYNGWQQRLIEGLMAGARRVGAGNRIGVFSRWADAKTEVSPSVFRHRIIRNYVHSKVAIVDDKWATFGSANLEGTGLNQAQHLGHLGMLFGLSRGSEVNAVIYDRVPPNPTAAQPSGPALPASLRPWELRRKLWSEHLGDDADVDTKPTEPGGWLKLWTDRAQAKLAALKLSPPQEHPARILPWVPKTDPSWNLGELGIIAISVATSPDGSLDIDYRRPDLEVLTSVRSFDLEKGLWK